MQDDAKTVPESFTDHYLITTPEQDREAIHLLNEMVREKVQGPYRLTDSMCRTFSKDMYDYFKNKFSQENKNKQSSKKEGSCK